MIRHASPQDFEAVKSIKQSLGIKREQLQDEEYKFSLQKSGFLLFPDLDRPDFEKDLKKLFLVYEEESTVVGYVRIDTKQEMDQGHSPLWFREDLKSTYFSHPHADIGGIAVSPAASHKGVGTALLKAVEKELKKQNVPYIFSFVVFSPITNIPSILFHEKHGFERIALTHYPKLFGMKNYQSILYGKKL